MPKRGRDVVEIVDEKEAFAAGLLYVPDRGIAMVRSEHLGRTGLVLPNRKIETPGPNRREVARLAVLEATGYNSQARFHLQSPVRPGNTHTTLFLMDGAELDSRVDPSENLEFVPITAEDPINPDILLFPDDARILDPQRAFLLGSYAVRVGAPSPA